MCCMSMHLFSLLAAFLWLDDGHKSRNVWFRGFLVYIGEINYLIDPGCVRCRVYFGELGSHYFPDE